MEEPYGGDDLFEDGPGLALREELLPHDLVQQLAAAHELEHEAHLEANRSQSHCPGQSKVTIQLKGGCAKIILFYLFFRLEHVPQRDDVLVLAVPQQDLDLLHAVPLGLQ